jgi:monoamine oxidase
VRVHYGESATREPQRSAEKVADPRRITALRRELADAEHALRAGARREAARLAHAEHAAWREARDACHAFDRIRRDASARLDALRVGSPERFPGERPLAEMALHEADRADAAYTVISFARRSDRLRYLCGGDERKAVVREAIARGGVFTDACGGNYFQEILR